MFISVFYTAPPFRFVHRGIGEICVFLGFGPIMTIGAYFVQAKAWSWEAIYASLPVAILIALVLYVNEVPDRPGDAKAGKRTLPVRWTKPTRAVDDPDSTALDLPEARVRTGTRTRGDRS